MSERTTRVLARLIEVGFQAREGGIAPFGEELPLVTGVAWDSSTAQVALVAESAGAPDEQAWRQLLFAASGLRHHLAEEQPPAFGTPLVLAIVDPESQRALRGIVEDLTSSYAVFSRVDLNLIRYGDLANDDALDTALAPLLPCCREAMGTTIARPDVERFWAALRASIANAATELPELFGSFRDRAADELGSSLIGSSVMAEEISAPVPVRRVRLRGFRSFVDSDVSLSPVTVIHGANGSGKSSLLEALELLWSGSTQRRPPGVSPAEYARHLPRRGEGDFRVDGDLEDHPTPITVEKLAETPTAELARSVLTQEAVAALVNGTPADRYSQLLAITGLEIPDLDGRTRQLLDRAKQQADDALVEAGLPPLRGANRDGLKHLREALSMTAATRIQPPEELAAAEYTLASDSAGTYTARPWEDDAELRELAQRLDNSLSSVTSQLTASPALREVMNEASRRLRDLAARRRKAGQSARQLLDALRASSRPSASPLTAPGPIPARLAIEWISHAESVSAASNRFRKDSRRLDDPVWSARLNQYADGLDRIAEAVPTDELREFARAAPLLEAASPKSVPDRLFNAAGFTRVPPEPLRLVEHLEALSSQLHRHAEDLDTLASELDSHPALKFAEHSEHILAAICRYELARNIRRQGPIARASADLLSELLVGRLYPVLRELVAAMVRFEWYFEPLRLSVDGRQVIIGGLATPRADLDARMLLNSAERTVVGVAWFLALHLLQPVERRRVLVLDDPTAAFDAVNAAGFMATLRAFTRLSRPDQLIVATHDIAAATLLSDEFGPVEGWPVSVSRVRCRRDNDDQSVATVEWTNDRAADLEAEEGMLGLGGDPTLFAQTPADS